MSYLIFGLAAIVALVDWLAVARDWRRVEMIAKPGVMVMLLAWLIATVGLSGRLAWFAAGLVFSLAGDIFLIPPRESFLSGLFAFLLAHCAYLIGFNPDLPPINVASIALSFLVVLAAWQVYRRIARSLIDSGQQHLAIPVAAYFITINLMLLSALMTLVRPEWPALPALMVSIGALSFVASDACLAWNRFIASICSGRLIVMVSYHLGQALIILGAALYYQP